MTPTLIDILMEEDKGILKTEKVFYNYINNIVTEVNIPLTNDQAFVASISKKVDAYEAKTSETILESLEKSEIPAILLTMNQLDNKERSFQSLLSKEKEVKEGKIEEDSGHQKIEKLRTAYLSHYLYDPIMGKKAKKSHVFDTNKPLDTLPFIIGDSVNDLGRDQGFIF